MKKYSVTFFNGEIGTHRTDKTMTTKEIERAVFEAGTGFDELGVYDTLEEAKRDFEKIDVSTTEYDSRGRNKIISVCACELWEVEYDEDGEIEREEIISDKYPEYIGSEVKKAMDAEFEFFRDEIEDGEDLTIDYGSYKIDGDYIRATASNGHGKMVEILYHNGKIKLA